MKSKTTTPRGMLSHAAEADAQAEASAGERTTLVRVTGPAAGRWRAGQRFGAEPQEVELTGRQLAAVEADPLLTVEETF